MHGSPTKPERPLVIADALTRVFRSGSDEIRALDAVSFRIEPGECVGLIGHSGSGKTTALNLIAGLDRATSGRLCVQGNDLSERSRRELARYRSHQIGIVFQGFHLLPFRTARENVALGLRFHALTPRERLRRADSMLERVGLTHRATHRPDSLSGGEKQRIALARALVKEPALLLADEPTGNLDRATTDGMEALLQEFHHQGQTILLVSHDTALAERLCDRLLHLEYGSIVGETAP